jgi:hypothetical protein
MQYYTSFDTMYSGDASPLVCLLMHFGFVAVVVLLVLFAVLQAQVVAVDIVAAAKWH